MFSGTIQIADGFVLGLGDMEGSELIGAMEPRQRFRIATIGLDTIAGPAGGCEGLTTARAISCSRRNRWISKPHGPAS